MQRILCMCMCISCSCRFMMLRKIIRIPNLTITNYLPWISLNWSVRWFAVVQRSTCTFCCIPSHASVGEMSEGEMSRGEIPFPDVLVWSTKLVDGRPRVLHLRRSSASRLNAQCMRQITPGHWHCHRSVYRIRLSFHVSAKLYADLYLTFREISKPLVENANFSYRACIW